MSNAGAASILCAGQLPEPLMSQMLTSFGAVVLPASDAGRSKFLTERGSEFQVLVTNAVLGFTGELLEELPGVELVASFGVGLDALDLAAARERGVQVSYTPDVLTGCVADLAVGLLIDVLRGVSQADRFVRTGDWARGGTPPGPGRRVHGARVGILGLGAIGSAVADRLRGFGCQLSYHNRTRNDSDVRYVDDPVQLARDCDVLVVTVAGGEETRGIVSREVIAALGPSGYLVNVSRGSNVDELALAEALSAGRLAGAALDVFSAEPHVSEELLRSDRVVLLPHIGSATAETRVAMSDLVVDNVRAYVDTGRVLTPAYDGSRPAR